MTEYDIYELIYSQEIRDYFRKTWRMGIKEQVQLVALSYEDIREKVKILQKNLMEVKKIKLWREVYQIIWSFATRL